MSTGERKPSAKAIYKNTSRQITFISYNVSLKS